MNTGTPIEEKACASVCSVTVFPVPVAPVMRPWRFATPGSRPSSVLPLFAKRRGGSMAKIIAYGRAQQMGEHQAPQGGGGREEGQGVHAAHQGDHRRRE